MCVCHWRKERFKYIVIQVILFCPLAFISWVRKCVMCNMGFQVTGLKRIHLRVICVKDQSQQKTNTLEMTKNRPHSSLISIEEDVATHGQMNRWPLTKLAFPGGYCPAQCCLCSLDPCAQRFLQISDFFFDNIMLQVMRYEKSSQFYVRNINLKFAHLPISDRPVFTSFLRKFLTCCKFT